MQPAGIACVAVLYSTFAHHSLSGCGHHTPWRGLATLSVFHPFDAIPSDSSRFIGAPKGLWTHVVYNVTHRQLTCQVWTMWCLVRVWGKVSGQPMKCASCVASLLLSLSCWLVANTIISRVESALCLSGKHVPRTDATLFVISLAYYNVVYDGCRQVGAAGHTHHHVSWARTSLEFSSLTINYPVPCNHISSKTPPSTAMLSMWLW